VLVFDTSAFINGWRYHYPPQTYPFGLVWERIGQAMDDGRVIAPRMVLVELRDKDDDVYGWVRWRASLFVEPRQAVQQQVGAIEALFKRPGVRDRADPFVMAEAKVRGFTVVTYEGTNTFTGRPTKKADEKMPGMCRRLGIGCCLVPEALARLDVAV
jgi:hypothetical protein